MIICEICQENLSETRFSSIIWEMGYPPICFNCYNTEKAQQLILDTIEKQQVEIEQRRKHNAEVAKRKREQIYEGQYDWMGEY